MRCFVSIEMPEEVQKELAKIQKQIPSEDAKLLLVNPDILHLTLRFLGELNDEELSKVKNALKNVKFQKFTAKLNSIGVFPNENFIRVVWVGLEPSEKFKELNALVNNEIEKIGISKDERFESHVTLARVKWIKEKKGFIDALNKIKIKPLEFAVDSIKLKKSTLTPEGPIYEDILEIKRV